MITKNKKEKAPVVVIVPGICGDTSTSYVFKLAQQVHQKLGWRAVVVNKRGYLMDIT